VRKDQFDTTVTIDGVLLGTFDSMTGGESDSDSLTYKPGGMAPIVTLGGTVTVGQVIIARLYRLERDHQTIAWLLSRVGKGSMVVKKQPLDTDGNTYGKPIVTSGVLKRVTPPEVDSTSGDAALIELEMTPSGHVSA
jgi:hypothetical protein